MGGNDYGIYDSGIASQTSTCYRKTVFAIVYLLAIICEQRGNFTPTPPFPVQDQDPLTV